MKPLYTSAQLRSVEAQALAAGEPLMALAGQAATRHALELLRSATHHPPRVLVLAGPGNNGGDAFEVATNLRLEGVAVELLFLGDENALPPNAARALERWGAHTLATPPTVLEADLIVDGLFGIGLKRKLEALLGAFIARINASEIAVLALDVPSGLHADTGSAMGWRDAPAASRALIATRTVTFMADKPGLHTHDGLDYAGEVRVESLGVDLPTPTAHWGGIVEPHDFAALLTPRRANTHKGEQGTVLILGGAPGMAGAAILAGRAALALGAGKVSIGFLDPQCGDVGSGGTGGAHGAPSSPVPAFDPLTPELMLGAASYLQRSGQFERASVIALGPGLGQSRAAVALLEACVALETPLILDADALNLLAQHTALATSVARRIAPTYLTPHPLEAARLLGTTTAKVQQDRFNAACSLARLYRACVLLKGAGSVVAWLQSMPETHPEGSRAALLTSAAHSHNHNQRQAVWAINPTGNPGMASGGMGDALTGLLATLVAQRPLTLARQLPLLAVAYLHGAAADACVAQSGAHPHAQTIGLTASETIVAARRLWNAWVDRPPLLDNPIGR